MTNGWLIGKTGYELGTYKNLKVRLRRSLFLLPSSTDILPLKGLRLPRVSNHSPPSRRLSCSPRYPHLLDSSLFRSQLPTLSEGMHFDTRPPSFSPFRIPSLCLPLHDTPSRPFPSHSFPRRIVQLSSCFSSSISCSLFGSFDSSCNVHSTFCAQPSSLSSSGLARDHEKAPMETESDKSRGKAILPLLVSHSSSESCFRTHAPMLL
jgi:hypothetical protein